jgi:hypothetical protein
VVVSSVKERHHVTLEQGANAARPPRVFHTRLSTPRSSGRLQCLIQPLLDMVNRYGTLPAALLYCLSARYRWPRGAPPLLYVVISFPIFTFVVFRLVGPLVR